MSMYDTYGPRPIHSDADGFTDLVRQLDRAEPWRVGAAPARELGFNEELRFEERSPARKRTTAVRAPRSATRVKASAATAPNPGSELRLVAAAATDENLAVADAQLHARRKSSSWKQYVENMDIFLDRQIDSNERR